MTRVLGVACSSATALLAVVEDGEVVMAGPQRLDVVQAGEAAGALLDTIEQWEQVLAEVAPQAIALLLPESVGNTKHPHSYWRSRIQMETLLAVAAARRHVRLDDIARATVRSKLGLTGKLETTRGIIHPVGKYWNEGRRIAALAALVVAQEMPEGAG